MNLKFKLLIENSSLNSDNYQIIQSEYLKETLGAYFKLPSPINKPFIFSCFALSVDGKLCYPDIKTGYAIAANNSSATKEERYADYWNLLLGRSISDAVIIGTNSLINENCKFTANIDNEELVTFRNQLGKPTKLLHILITRDIDNFNIDDEIIYKNLDIPLLIYSAKKPVKPYTLPVISINDLNDKTIRQIIYDNGKFNFRVFFDKLFMLGIKTILNESPFLHHELQETKLLDEAWLNTSSVYIGGSINSLGMQNESFSSVTHPHYTILTLHTIANNFLYTRYQITY